MRDLLWGDWKKKLTIFVTQSIGPLYRRLLFSAEYWTCRRALTCSTGAAIRLTVHPAPIPAKPCPAAGSFFEYSCMFLSEGRREDGSRVRKLRSVKTFS